MASSRSWKVEPEDFDELLRENSDSEDDVCKVECFDVQEAEFEEQRAVMYELDSEYLEPDREYDGPPASILGLYTQDGTEIPLGLSSTPSDASLSPAFMPRSPHSSAAMPVHMSPSVMQPSSPLRAPLSPSPAECSEYVVVTLEEGGGVAYHDGEDDDALGQQYHLADEHLVYQQKAERPERLQRGRGRGCPRGRGGGRLRGGRGARGARGQGSRGRQTGEPQWKKGERLVEVHVNDDDVPEELRVMVMRVVNAREAARERATARARRQTAADGEAHEEERSDADDGEDEVLFAGGASSPRFEWLPMDNYSGEREQFLPQQVGPVVASENAYGAFRQYWDDGILSHIVTETNRYAQWLAESSVSFRRGWYDTNIHELLVLFSFWMMLGIIRMPSTKSCFTTNPLLQTNIFRKMFSRDRYESLCRALHFNDDSNRPTDNCDRLFSFGPVLEHLNSRFKEAYIPSQNICIDESLTLWKGNLSFRQYIKTKAAKFGVKTFELCESSTGYLWSFFVYLGKSTTYDPAFPSTLLKSTSTVLKLVHPLLDKGYTLFMDNWFNSPLLARFLKARKTDCVGTLRANRRNVPPLIPLCKLKDGQFAARHSGDIVVMAYQDKKRKVSTISTYHGIQQDRMEPKPHREAEFKPQVILDYNKGMGGVDRKDQMLEPYLLERKRCANWTMKVFKRLLNCSILNSRIHLEASTSTSKHHLVFRLELVEQLLQHHHEHMPKLPRPPYHGQQRPGPSGLGQQRPGPSGLGQQRPGPSGLGQQRPGPSGLGQPRPGPSGLGQQRPGPSGLGQPRPGPSGLGQQRPSGSGQVHWPTKVTEVLQNGRHARRRCLWCSQQRVQKRTTYVCSVCDVPLCIEPCFKLYHATS